MRVSLGPEIVQGVLEGWLMGMRGFYTTSWKISKGGIATIRFDHTKVV